MIRQDDEHGEVTLTRSAAERFAFATFDALAARFESQGETFAVVAHVNITQRKLAEEATRFRSNLLNTVEQAVIATDLGGTITYWNRFAEKLYGWSAAEIVGRNIMEVVLPQDAHERASEIMSRLQAGESVCSGLWRRSGRGWPTSSRTPRPSSPCCAAPNTSSNSSTCLTCN